MIAPLAVRSPQPNGAVGAPPPRVDLLAASEADRIERAVRALLPAGRDLDPHLAAAIADTLATPGSLWRAQLAFAVARAAGLAPAASEALATGVEAFHTASLLFDDLPSMDDAGSRRGRPCVHRVHGEAAAQLAALAFVHRGYSRLWQAFEPAETNDRRAAAALVEECLGASGILDGQARDVGFGAGDVSASEVLRIATRKTVTLLRLALELPAVVAGVAPPIRARLARLAEAWGLAYQILDDLRDDMEVGAGGADARLGRPNLAHALGRGGAEARLDLELRRAESELDALARELPGVREPFVRLSFRFAGSRRALAAPTSRG